MRASADLIECPTARTSRDILIADERKVRRAGRGCETDARRVRKRDEEAWICML